MSTSEPGSAPAAPTPPPAGQDRRILVWAAVVCAVIIVVAVVAGVLVARGRSAAASPAAAGSVAPAGTTSSVQPTEGSPSSSGDVAAKPPIMDVCWDALDWVRGLMDLARDYSTPSTSAPILARYERLARDATALAEQSSDPELTTAFTTASSAVTTYIGVDGRGQGAYEALLNSTDPILDRCSILDSESDLTG